MFGSGEVLGRAVATAPREVFRVTRYFGKEAAVGSQYYRGNLQFSDPYRVLVSLVKSTVT